jgi:hypothetical protein
MVNFTNTLNLYLQASVIANISNPGAKIKLLDWSDYKGLSHTRPEKTRLQELHLLTDSESYGNYMRTL